MRMLVCSLGCDLLCNDKDIKDRVNQLNNYLILKKRILSISFVFFLSFLGLIFPSRDWITLLFSSIMYLLYSFLFVPLFNKKVIRRIKLLDAIGIAVPFLLIFNAVLGMFTQAFRYAYEPFVFGKNKEEGSKKLYADAMKYFIIVSLIAYLGVMFYLDIFRYIIAKSYWDGLDCVSIVMIAAILNGIYFNLSFWYKLIDKTIWGAYFSGIGCFLIIILNVIFVPHYGYMACA